MPSLLAIFLALYSKNVLLSLFSGTILGVMVLNDFALISTLEGTIDLFTKLLSTPWILKTLGFVILVGSIMALIERSGGVSGFINYILNKKEFVKSPRSALMISYILGVVIFIETSITALISGAVGKPFCDKYKIPHEKLAFVCDSTSAPIGSLVIINGYGVLLLGLITTQISQGNLQIEALSTLLDAILFNFYSISALIVTFLFIWFDFNIGPMKEASYVKRENIVVHKNQSMYLMIAPISLMLILIFVFLYITGDGDILKGSGSSSIFYTMIATWLFTLFYYVGSKNMNFKEWSVTSFYGAKKLFMVSMILVFAFSIGSVTSELKTGQYLASFASENLNVIFLAGILFLLSSLMSFSTGTSWGTFSIMIPVAIPMAVGMDANISLCIGAVISGGIFGDHCSPISDTTIISSMAADCEIIDHVKTQLPYALISGVIAFILFVVFSFLVQ
ncbi:sodium:proton antiporter [Sulfurimonas sp.]|nr:sodium:proton antiporter [Sulfurimonas sp.]